MKRTKVWSICLTIIFAAAIALLLQPAQVNAESRELYRYSIEDGEAVITGADESLSGDVVLPSVLDGCPVTAIEECAFYYREGLTSVVIPEGIKEIGFDAFHACPDLKTVTLPDSVTTIEQGAFCDSSLGRVLIPASVTQMGESAFRGISSIRFRGDMPAVVGEWEAIEATYYGSKVNVYYPAGNTTWADEAARATICKEANWVESKSYEITEGADAQISEKGLSATVCTEDDGYYFIGVCIDGKWVEPENYTVTDGTGITFSAEYISTLKTGEHQVTLAFAEGDAQTTLAIRWKLVGDLNSKDDVDEDDAIYLLQHVLMSEAFPVDQNVDFDKNGTVDEDDAIYLLQHVLMPDIFQL